MIANVSGKKMVSKYVDQRVPENAEADCSIDLSASISCRRNCFRLCDPPRSKAGGSQIVGRRRLTAPPSCSGDGLTAAYELVASQPSRLPVPSPSRRC
jgi:hypothetical protein